MHLFERIQAALQEAADRRGWPVRFSVGIVTYRSAPTSVQDMLKTADDFMYEAKRERRGGIRTRIVE